MSQDIIHLQKVDTPLEAVTLQKQLIKAGWTIIDVQPVHNGYLAGFSYFVKYKGKPNASLDDCFDS